MAASAAIIGSSNSFHPRCSFCSILGADHAWLEHGRLRPRVDPLRPRIVAAPPTAAGAELPYRLWLEPPTLQGRVGAQRHVTRATPDPSSKTSASASCDYSNHHRRPLPASHAPSAQLRCRCVITHAGHITDIEAGTFPHALALTSLCAYRAAALRELLHTTRPLVVASRNTPHHVDPGFW